MDKQALRKIEISDPAETVRARAEENQNLKWIVSYHKLEGGVDCIALYDATRIRRGIDGPRFLNYLTNDDYITRDTTDSRTKWYTGQLWKVINESWYRRSTSVFLTEEDGAAFRARFPEAVWNDWVSSITHWQNDVLEIRKQDRYKKELAETDAIMAQIPAVPDDFREFVVNEVMYKYRYMIYKHTTKTRGKAYCTACNHAFEFSRKDIHMKRDERGKCPICGSDITYKHPNSLLDSDWYDWALLIQKAAGGVVIRGFRCFARFEDAGGLTGVERRPDIWFSEEVRGLYTTSETSEVKMKLFEMGSYKQQGGPERWCPDHDNFDCTKGILYTNNLPQELAGTPFQYCAIDLFQKAHEKTKCHVWNYMRRYPENRYLEGVVKAGMINLADDLTQRYATMRFDEFKERFMDLPKIYRSQFRRINGKVKTVRLLRQCSADKILLRDDDLIRFEAMFGDDDETLGMLNARAGQIGLKKFMNYIEKQIWANPKQYCSDVSCHLAYANGLDVPRARNALTDWKDYISLASALKYDLNDEYYYLPPDLSEAHDRVVKEHKKNEDKIARRKLREQEKLFKQMMKEGCMDGMVLKTKDLMIVVPKSLEDIKAEGRELHHCVGTYCDKVAKGETMILFVRKVEAPDQPYYTMEWKDKKVVQCRGVRNQGMTKEVSAFVKTFETKMKKADLMAAM